MKSASRTLGGVVVPAITPIDAEDRVDEPAFARGLERLVAAGVHGIFVGGSAGEGRLLSERELRRMAEIARQTVGDPLLGGAMDTSTRRAVIEAAVGMEIVACNVPSCTGTVLAVDTVCELARPPRSASRPPRVRRGLAALTIRA